MARDYGPFPDRPMYEVVNRRMQKALAEASRSTGFVKSGQGAVTAGTGAQLIIAAYPDGALIDGLYVENPTTETVTLTTNSGSTNPRIDRLVMRLDMTAKTIAPYQIVGTPAASPTAPPLVNTDTVVDLPLCRYTMPGSASAQNPGSIVDERPCLELGRAALHQSVAQTFSASGWNQITLDDESIDTHGGHAAGAAGYTVPAGQAGPHRIEGVVWFAAFSSSVLTIAGIRVNGARIPAWSGPPSTQGGGSISGAVTGAKTINLNVGDVVTLWGFVGAPGWSTVQGSDGTSSLTITRIA